MLSVFKECINWFFYIEPNNWSLHHLLFTLSAMITIAVSVYFITGKTKKQIDVTVKYTAVVIFVLEVIKIGNAFVGSKPSLGSWVPLWFCSLFIYASLMYGIGKKTIKRIGLFWLVYGQLMGGLFFLAYPTTSLSLHTWLYHVSSAVVGLSLLIENIDEFHLHDVKLYSVSLLAVEAFVFLFNFIFDCNMMFINDPGGVAPLNIIASLTGPLYPLVFGLGQCFGTFFLSYLVILLFKKFRNPEKERKAEKLKKI